MPAAGDSEEPATGETGESPSCVGVGVSVCPCS